MNNAATSETSDRQGIKGWSADVFATVLGLETRINGQKPSEKVYLGKADIDRATGGIVHLETYSTNDKRTGAPLNLDIQFSTLQANGQLARQHVFQIESTRNGKEIVPTKIYCLGNKIYDAALDGPDFDVQVLNNVFQAVQDLNNIMRPPYNGQQGEYSPRNILKILNKNNLVDIIAEDLEQKFYGVDDKGNFDFDYRDVFNKNAANDNALAVMPSRDFARAVIGDQSVNTLDYSQSSLKLMQPRFASHGPSGVLYGAQNKVSDTKTKLGQSTALSPAGPTPAGVKPMSIPSLFQFEFRSAHRGNDAQGEQKLKSMSLFGKPLNGDNPLELARALRLANRYNHDQQNGQYPHAATHLITSDLYEHAYDIPPPVKGETRVDIIRFQGNSTKKIVADMGDQLGDCTALIHKFTDNDGITHEQGFIIDVGASFAPKYSEYSLGVPDITKILEVTDDIAATHHHFDHVGGLAIYADRGLIADPEYYKRTQNGANRGKTLHATDKQIERLQTDFKNRNIPAEQWPRFKTLKGQSWLHIRNKETGQLAFSVQSSAEGTPHSANTTPYKIYAYNGNKLQFCLLKPGDYRGERDNEDYKGNIPLDRMMDRDFFESGAASIIAEQQRMLNDGEIKPEEMFDPAEIKTIKPILEIDGTNYKKPGYGPMESQVEDNEVAIKETLHANKLILDAMISTSDAGLKRKLRVAVRTNSHFSLGGANLENAGRIFNKTGVNANLVEPTESRNIQAYMDFIYSEIYKIDVQDFEDDLYWYNEECKDSTEKTAFIKRFLEKDYAHSPEKMRGLLFTILSANKQSNTRYARQLEFEHLLEETYDEKMPLGSIFTGRDSQTLKDMVKHDKGRVLFVMTGTQGTENESEAWLNKLVDGRSVFDANPKNRATAIPLSKNDYVVRISQGVIPGNESDRYDMVRKAVNTLKVPLLEAVGEGFRHFNFKSKTDETKTKALYEELGGFVTHDNEGVMVVHKVPIYASGHGYKKDVQDLIALVDPSMVSINHTEDVETITEFVREMRELGIQTPGEMIENFTTHTYAYTPETGEVQNQILGRIMPSMLLVTEKREYLKQYGGYTTAERVVSYDGEGGVISDALLAGENMNPDSGLTLLTHFPSLSGDKEDKDSAKRSYYQRRSKTDITGPEEDKRYAGPMSTKKDKVLPGLEQSFDALLDELGITP